MLEENNKLIAEFLGWEIYTRFHYLWGEEVKQYKNLQEPYYNFNDGYIYVGHEQFHNSWSWLIPVFSKCRKVVDSIGDFECEEYQKWEEIFDIDYTMSNFLNNEIDQIYKRCVEFIKYHNKNIKND